MDKLPFPLEDSLVDNPPKVFSDLKYCVEGKLDPKIVKLLENGGATQVKYPTTSTAYMIAGEGANDVTLQEAEEIFELPVVQPRWVAFSAKVGKLLPTVGFDGQNKRLFSSIRIASAGIKGTDLDLLWALVTSGGGTYSKNLLSSTTHLVTNSCESEKYKCAKQNGIKVVCCDWITECLKAKSLVSETKYDPQYLSKPEPAKNVTQQAAQSKTSQKSEASTSKGAGGRPVSKANYVRPPSLSKVLPYQFGKTPFERGTAIRQQLHAKNPGAPASTQIRAHRPLMVNSPQQQQTAKSTATSSGPASSASTTLSVTAPPPVTTTAQGPNQKQQQKQNVVLPPPPPVQPCPTPQPTTPQQHPPQATPVQQPQPQPQPQSQLSATVQPIVPPQNKPSPTPPVTLQQQVPQVSLSQSPQPAVMPGQVIRVTCNNNVQPLVPVHAQQQQTDLQKPIMSSQSLQPQQQQQTAVQTQAQSHQLPQQQQIQMQQQTQLVNLQPQQQNQMNQQHLQQQQIHPQQQQPPPMMSQHQPMPMQQAQLQTALSQPPNQPSPHSLQMIQHNQQQNLQMHLQQLHPNVSTSAQGQGVMQGQHPQSQQQQPLQAQQMQHMHHQAMQQNAMSPMGIQGHQQQNVQLQRPPSQPGHPGHLTQQLQAGAGQGHQGLQGMQFQQNQHQLQQSLNHQLQMQQQGLQPMQQQVVQAPQKSPMQMPPHSQMQCQPPPQQMSMQQGGLVHQIGGPPQNPNQQGYPMQNQQQQQILQQQLQQQQHIQNQQQQQFSVPGPPKTPPNQMHPQSPQHQQLMSQQQQQQMQNQGVMRPPQPPQQNQNQGQQSVHFQLLPPQSNNRLQVVMQAKPQFQQGQGQPPTSNAPPMQMNSPQQGIFRPQQHPQQNQMMQPNQQGQLFHSLQQPQLQQARPQGMLQLQQHQQPQAQQGQNQPGGHQVQIMQGSNSHVQGLQPLSSPQLMQTKQFQEIGPAPGQQGQQHYNVVIHQGQQFTQMNPPPPRNLGPPRHPMPGQPQQVQQVGQVGQKIGAAFPVNQPQNRPNMHQWTQMEIFRQIQLDPNIKAKWNQMDQQQRQLLVQKLAQRHREDQLRKEMMLRQQQLNQQNASMQQGLGQQPNQQQIAPPGSPHLLGQQQQQGQQTILVQQQQQQQQQQPLTPTSQSPVPNQDKLNQQQGAPVVPQPTASPLAQSNSPQMVPMPGSPVIAGANSAQQQQQQIMQLSQQSQQKMLSPQSPSPTLKFPPPSPVQGILHGQHPQQSQATGTIVRTQQVYTPQVGSHSPQQRMVNVQHVLVHQQPQQSQPQQQQQQQTRFPQQHQIILQHPQQPLPGTSQVGSPQQKVTVLQGPQQSPGQPMSSPQQQQWVPGSPHPQRLASSPQSTTTPFPMRMQSPDGQQRGTTVTPTGQVWNGRQPSPVGVGPTTPTIPPGTPTSPQFVQVVNSKTKTALANLLNNRLQGNNTGTDSSTATTSISSSSTTHLMCEASHNNLSSVHCSSSLSLQQTQSTSPQSQFNVATTTQRKTLSNLTNSSKTLQVNTYGGAAATTVRAPVSLNQSPTPVAMSPTRTTFYGHEPSFKAPQNGFLVGCVFWPVQLVDPPENWVDIVTYYGGEVVSEYNPARVTHIICKNQKFPEFQQVLRDGKRLVTLHWLSDVCARKVMAPPFYAMHLPANFSDDNLPLKRRTFTTTGFESDDRERIIKMVKLLGGDFISYFTFLSSGLIAARTDTLKFARAREYKKPIINVQFLNELLLGNTQSVLQMVHSPKYQVFNVDQPFRFDISIAPHLMAAWKTPVRVNAEVVEKFKGLKRPLDRPDDVEQQRKRRTIENEEKQLPLLEETEGGEIKDDKDGNTDVENRPPPVITFTGFTDKFITAATAKLIMLGGRVTEKIEEATHLVCWELVTVKVYSAICALKYIVSAKWIQESFRAKRFVDETPFIPDLKSFSECYNTTIADVLKKPNRNQLFKGYTFYVTPGIVGFFRNDIISLIESGSGVVDTLPSNSLADLKLKAKKYSKKYIIIASIEDYHYLVDYLYFKVSKPLSIFWPFFLYKCVVEQKVDVAWLSSKKTPLPVAKDESANSG